MVNIDKVIEFSAGICILRSLDSITDTTYDKIDSLVDYNDYDPDELAYIDSIKFDEIKSKVITRIRELCLEFNIKSNIGDIAEQLLNAQPLDSI